MTLRVASLPNRLLAAVLVALLPLAVLGGEALAQSATQDDTTGDQSRPIIGTITNTAEARWKFEGTPASSLSNEVTFDVP